MEAQKTVSSTDTLCFEVVIRRVAVWRPSRLRPRRTSLPGQRPPQTQTRSSSRRRPPGCSHRAPRRLEVAESSVWDTILEHEASMFSLRGWTQRTIPVQRRSPEPKLAIQAVHPSTVHGCTCRGSHVSSSSSQGVPLHANPDMHDALHQPGVWMCLERMCTFGTCIGGYVWRPRAHLGPEAACSLG